MRDEMRQHLDRATERLMARGLSAAEARTAALREFGNVHYLQEEARDARGGRWLEALTPDAKLALRMLVKSPLLSVVGGLGMAVAIAIATVFFAFVTFYYSDVPVEDGDRVVAVDYIDLSDYRSTLFDYQLWKDELESIEDLAAYRTVSRDLESPIMGTGPVDVAEMTASGFRVARVPPLLGRPLLDSDEVEGAPPVVVIGYREWHQRFGADPAAVGRQVRLDGTAYTVVGVMPEGFRLPVNHGFWTPMVTGTPLDAPVRGPQVRVFGRLAPGVAAAAAEAEIAPISDRILAEYPQVYERRRAAVVPYVRRVLGLEGVPAWAIWLSQLFTGLILIAVAVNVAVLFYARTALRRVEITVRTALGASRSRIVTQLFLEALALSALAAALGLLIAEEGFRRLTLLTDSADDLPYWLVDGLPPATILYAAGLAALAALVVGVLPALQATGRRLESTLREMGGGTGLSMGRTWTALICAQVAVAVGVLPAVVGIAWNYAPPPTPTFPASEILSFRLRRPPPLRTVDSGEPRPDAEYGILQAELLRRVEDVPGVSSVTFLAEGAWGYIEVEDPVGAAESNVRLTGSVPVDIEYFSAFGVPLLAGRTFDRNDAVEGATAAIVNRAFVDEYFAGGAALGRRFREMTPGADEESEAGPWFEVVGLIENMLRPSGRGRRASPRAYHAMALGTEPLELAARTRGIGPADIAPRVREIAAEIAPGYELWSTPMHMRYAGDPAELRFILLMVGLATLSVLLLSAAGISAMMSFAVTQRQREVGIRTALGATRRQVIASIFSRSTRQLGIGLVIGASGAAFLDRLAGGDILGGEVGPLLALVAAIMLLSGLLATLGPARRALRIQPMDALREE
jgi:predicted permease